MDIVVRKAKPADLTKLQKLGTELMLSDSRFDSLLDKQWYVSETGKQFMLESIKSRNHICFVAEIKDEIIGYASCKLLTEETWRLAPRAELVNLVVTAPYRNHGVGHQLMDAFKGWATDKGAKKVKVQSCALNEDAIRFYKATGFRDQFLALEADL